MDRDLLKEKTIHGDMMFPLSVYSIDQNCGNSIVIDCHWHDELEFLIMTEGSALFQVDTMQYEVSNGQGIFVNGGELHAAHALGEAPRSFRAIVFDLSFLNSGKYDILQSRYIDRILDRQFTFPRHIKGDSPAEQQLLSMLAGIVNLVIEKPYTYEMQVKALLYQIFSSILSNIDPNSSDITASADHYRMERIKNALKLIHDGYGKKLSTKDIAAALNLSEGHFCRMFKQFVKKTPIEYINYYRVNKAARMLETTDKKVIDTAMEVGFDNFSYFIGTFRHYMGVTPAKYRILNRDGNEQE